MTFGMPRALFVVLSLHVFHAGAAGSGLLYASVSLGAAVAALANGWLSRARRLGRITIAMVLIWGAAIAAAGLASSIVLAAVLLGVAGAADCDQRRLPHDDRPAGHAGGDARPHDVGVRPRRDRRRAPRRHRVGQRRGAQLGALRGRQRRPRLHRRRRRRAARVPGARALRRAVERSAGPAARDGCRLRRGVDPGALRHDHRRVGRARLRARGPARPPPASPSRSARATAGRAAEAAGARQRDGAASAPSTGSRTPPRPPRTSSSILSVPFRSHARDARPHRGVDARGAAAGRRDRAARGGRRRHARRGCSASGRAPRRSRRRSSSRTASASSARCTRSARATLGDLDHRLDEDVLIVGDRRADKQRVAALLESIEGLRCVDAGRLEMARITESLTALMISMNIRHKTHTGIRITGLPDERSGERRPAVRRHRRRQARPRPLRPARRGARGDRQHRRRHRDLRRPRLARPRPDQLLARRPHRRARLGARRRHLRRDGDAARARAARSGSTSATATSRCASSGGACSRTGATLSEAHDALSRALGVGAAVIPMSDDPVRTTIRQRRARDRRCRSS